MGGGHKPHGAKAYRGMPVQAIIVVVLVVIGISGCFVAMLKGPNLVGETSGFPGGPPTLKGGGGSLRNDGTDRSMRAQELHGARSSGLDEKFQVIFSTDCKPFQDWQSILVFLTARMVGHKGPITRIASGCTPQEQAEREAIYAKLDGGLGQFRLHVTPDFSLDKATGKVYVFYNKPGGLQHWLSSENGPPDDSVVALIDPDFIFMKPLSPKIRSEDILYTSPVKASELIEEVTEGQPVAQFYGIGDGWVKFNISHIAGADSPALSVSSGQAWKHYSIGPPYIVHKSDLVKIASLWHDFVPRVFEGHPHLLAEMYAYSIAAAHLELPHLRLDNYMTSDTSSYGEGWSFVDAIPDETVCEHDLSQYKFKLPGFLHYCQHYKVPPLKFWKRDIPLDLFSCETKPMEIPEQSAVNEMLEQETDKKKAKELKYHAFQHCQVKMKLNKAIKLFQAAFC